MYEFDERQPPPMADVVEMPHQWKKPVQIKSELPDVDKFPMEILPSSFEGFVGDVSKRMQNSSDFVAVGLIVALSSVIGNKFAVHPKQKDDWLIVPNLWGALVGKPSSMKSPTLAEALKPISKLESSAKEQHIKELKEYATDEKFNKLQVKKANKDAEKLIKEGDAEGARKVLGVVGELKQQPIRGRFKVNDSTIEKLGELLNQNPNGLLLERDELSGFIQGLEKHDRQSDKAFYLESWNGDSSFTYDRIGRGTLDISKVTVSIVGGIQPDKIKKQVQGAIRSDESNDGFIQRFQLMVYPDIDNKWSYVDEYPSKQAKDRVNEVFERLASIEADEQIKLRFSPDAQEIFIEWLTEHEKKLRSGLHPAIESHLTKYRSLVPSLALIIYLAESSEYEAINQQSVIKACAWASYLESHMHRVYSIGDNQNQVNARLLANRLNKLPDTFTLRDVSQKGWAGLGKDTKAIHEALLILEEHDYIQGVERQTNGRPTVDYLKNPMVVADE